MEYTEFLKTKLETIRNSGFECENINSKLFKWQQDVVKWALKKGKCALFEECGLGKTAQQLEFGKQVSIYTQGDILIFAPLAVSEQTKREGLKFDIDVNIAKDKCDLKKGINITNYERLDKFNLSEFAGIILDESSILKHHGSKIRYEITDACKDTLYKLEATATPSPNDYTEIGNHAEWLGIMKQKEMLSTFFVHDGGETQKWKLKGHAEQIFFEWIASWAACITNPKDIGYECVGYDLPELIIHKHFVDCERRTKSDGQIMLIADAIKQSLTERRYFRKNSIDKRTDLSAEIANINEQVAVWCDFNAESELLSKKISDAIEVKGADSSEHKTNTMLGFSNGEVRCIVSKPSIAGFGMNWQNCSNVVFCGLSDSFEKFYQAVRRFYRFGQKNKVNIHIVSSENDGAVMANIERKQKDTENLMKNLVDKTKEILASELHEIKKLSETYNATEQIIIPKWLRSN